MSIVCCNPIGSATQCVVTGLESGQVYHFRVVAETSAGRGDASQVVQTATQPGPTTLRCKPITTNALLQSVAFT